MVPEKLINSYAKGISKSNILSLFSAGPSSMRLEPERERVKKKSYVSSQKNIK